MDKLNAASFKSLILAQQDEITAYHVYKKIASMTKDDHNKEVINKIADDELGHYERLATFTGKTFKPQKLKVIYMTWITRIFGLTFGLKLLENNENEASYEYRNLQETVAIPSDLIEDEERHERVLIDMLNEERLNYIGSIVLGLNDALVELTGALAGFTFAFQNTRLIALTGLITGISASFSMAASEYLSTRQDDEDNALKSSLYTGMAYVFTVIFLILPYLLISNPFVCLGVTLTIAVIIIFVFNYYISVAKDYNFKKRFLEMAVISLGVAAISFVIGFLINKFIGIDV